MNKGGWLKYGIGFAGLSAAFVVAARERRIAAATEAAAGKVVLITGGSRGLGFALAQQFARLGSRLVLLARDGEELRRARQRLLDEGTAGQDVLVIQCDVTKVEAVRVAVSDAIERFGQIDVVVNNAGIILVGPVENQTLEQYERAMRLNFFGALHTTLAVLPSMLARGSGGVINIASIGGKIAFPHLLPYVASKFALVGWSEGIHAELAGKGIHVLTVTPGVMRTGSHIQAEFTGDEKKEYLWFASGATNPMTATDASAAAKKVVRAYLAGTAEISIGLQAVVASRLGNVSPALTSAVLTLANGMLPDSPGSTLRPAANDEPEAAVAGRAFRGSLPDVFENFGEEAIERYNQAL